MVGSIYRLAVHVHGSSAKRENQRAEKGARWELIIATHRLTSSTLVKGVGWDFLSKR